MRGPLESGRAHRGHGLHASAPVRVADRVWLVRGGLPLKTMNVYLIEEDGGGACLFDAGSADMAGSLARAAQRMGGVSRVVLGHAHPDHRGAAPALGAPVFCHPAERADAEGDGGHRTFDFAKLGFPFSYTLRGLLHYWDGGPVEVSGTLREGDEVAAGFKVVDLPGHAPGLIGLYREQDGVALTSDCFYTLDPRTSRKGAPRVPHPAFTRDTELARASLRKLAGLGPAAAWPGHADPILHDPGAQLERAAERG